MGDISTPDANRYPHHLYLDLKRREEAFTGAVIAIPIREKNARKTSRDGTQPLGRVEKRSLMSSRNQL